MAALQAVSKTAPCAAKAFGAQRPTVGRLSLAAPQPQSSCQSPTSLGPQLSVRKSAPRATQTQVAHQVFELADRGGFIGGTAATIFAMTLIGLAIGFVLLRVEALSEEGKL